MERPASVCEDLRVDNKCRTYLVLPVEKVMDDPSIKLTSREITAAFSEAVWAEKFPPILTITQAADLAQVSVGTLRDWRSRGLLRGCSRRNGKHVRFFRDRLVDFIFNGGVKQK